MVCAAIELVIYANLYRYVQCVLFICLLFGALKTAIYTHKDMWTTTKDDNVGK